MSYISQILTQSAIEAIPFVPLLGAGKQILDWVHPSAMLDDPLSDPEGEDFIVTPSNTSKIVAKYLERRFTFPETASDAYRNWIKETNRISLERRIAWIREIGRKTGISKVDFVIQLPIKLVENSCIPFRAVGDRFSILSYPLISYTPYFQLTLPEENQTTQPQPSEPLKPTPHDFACAHEFAHILQGDSSKLALISIGISLFHSALWLRGVRSSSASLVYRVGTTYATAFVAHTFTTLFKSKFMQWRERLADRKGMELLGENESARAFFGSPLIKIQSDLYHLSKEERLRAVESWKKK